MACLTRVVRGAALAALALLVSLCRSLRERCDECEVVTIDADRIFGWGE